MKYHPANIRNADMKKKANAVRSSLRNCILQSRVIAVHHAKERLPHCHGSLGDLSVAWIWHGVEYEPVTGAFEHLSRHPRGVLQESVKGVYHGLHGRDTTLLISFSDVLMVLLQVQLTIPWSQHQSSPEVQSGWPRCREARS